MNALLQSFLIALQFLTIIPVRLSEPVEPKNQGQSVLFYPLVGLILAGILLFGIYSLNDQEPLVIAILTLSLWVILTGGLHLDGLADSADAWLGGLGNKRKTLIIMKDPASGPIAVTILTLVLLIKFVMLIEIIKHSEWFSLVSVLILSRMALVMLLMTTPYARSNGLASSLLENLARRPLQIMLGGLGLFMLIAIDFTPLIIFLVSFLLLRYYMIRRLNGMTGDTAGAMLELLEAATLTAFVLFQR